MTLSIGLILIGLLLLILGGDWLIRGSVSIAQRLRLTPMVIGLTVVSFGTSAPEFLVSLQSALSGNAGIALGNVIGSNVFNILAILGLTATVCPIQIQGITLLDVGMQLGSVLLLWFFCFTKYTVARWEGALLSLLFIAYMAVLIG